MHNFFIFMHLFIYLRACVFTGRTKTCNKTIMVKKVKIWDSCKFFTIMLHREFQIDSL